MFVRFHRLLRTLILLSLIDGGRVEKAAAAVRGTRIAHIWIIDERPTYVYLECIINMVIIIYYVYCPGNFFFFFFKTRPNYTSEIAFFFRESAGFLREKFTIGNRFFSVQFFFDVRKITI